MITTNYHIHDDVEIGRNVTIGPGSVIGSDAFWFPRDIMGSPQPTETKGKLIIGDNVTILSNVCIARAIREGDTTVIGSNTKIDNMCHIAHDCDIGEGVRMAAGCILGGHVEVGRNTFIGLNTTILPKIKIGEFVLIGAHSNVTKPIPPFEVWFGNPCRKHSDDTYFRVDNSYRGTIQRCWYERYPEYNPKYNQFGKKKKK